MSTCDSRARLFPSDVIFDLVLLMENILDSDKYLELDKAESLSIGYSNSFPPIALMILDKPWSESHAGYLFTGYIANNVLIFVHAIMNLII